MLGGGGCDHLRAAFSEAYGIKPDPSAAYSRAVKAVEAVANPLFLSNDPEPTLGKVRSHLDQGRRKYEMVIADKTGAPADIDAVIAMISLLWHGQRDRHEGGPTSAPVTRRPQKRPYTRLRSWSTGSQAAASERSRRTANSCTGCRRPRRRPQ